MALQKYVRQLRPIQEKYVDHVEQVQSLLTEAANASTYMEGVIAECSNLYGKFKNNKKQFDRVVLNQPYIKLFLPLAKKQFATAGVKNKQKLADIFYDFGAVINKKTNGAKIDAGFGQTKPLISEFWTEKTTKKKDTSKADILIGKSQTSVKAPFAQLMSGKGRETKATILSAIKIAGADKDIEKMLFEQVDKFVDNMRTNSADINARVLKQMSVEDAKKTGNEEVKKLVDKQDAGKAEIKRVFETAFKDAKVANAFAQESMTGLEKFSGKVFDDYAAGDPKGEATHMFIWDYGMKKVRFEKITNTLISETAKKMNIRPDLKSLSYKSGGKKAGYSFYQAMRVTVKTVLDDTDKISAEANEEIKLNRQMLSEGMINEFKFKDTLKKIYTKVKDKIVGFVKKLIENIVQIAKKAKEVISKGISDALEYFELDVNVKVNDTVSFKV